MCVCECIRIYLSEDGKSAIVVRLLNEIYKAFTQGVIKYTLP